MADLSTFAQTVTNAGATGATLTTNYKLHKLATSDAGRTLIVKIAKTNITDADLSTLAGYLTTSHGDGSGTDVDGDDAFTIAGIGTADGTPFVSGETDVVWLRIQGTGVVNAATLQGLIPTSTVTIEAVFTPEK